MAERYDCQQVSELLFNDGFEFFDSSDSEEEDAGESSYLEDQPLDSEELESVHEAIIHDELTTRKTSTASTSALLTIVSGIVRMIFWRMIYLVSIDVFLKKFSSQ